MKRPTLETEPRIVLGKKVKKLRREGLVPANVYGKGLPSQALQIKLIDFLAVYKEVGETGVIDLKFDGKSKPVLIKNLQVAYPQHTPLHVDFFQVNMKEKVKAVVPVVLNGEPKAVTDKLGLLLQTLSDVEVEALPDNLPENIEVSVEELAELNAQITVGDLKAPDDVTILTAPDQTVAKIGELVIEEPEPEEPAEGEEGAEGETTEGEGEKTEEGAEKAEGDEKSESTEDTKEEKKD